MTGVIASMVPLEPVRFNGTTFDKTAAPATVTSDTRTATKPAASSGSVSARNFNMTGSVSPTYSINGGAFATLTEALSFTLARNDTLAFRISLAASGEALTFDFYDDATNSIIEQVTLAAS